MVISLKKFVPFLLLISAFFLCGMKHTGPRHEVNTRKALDKIGLELASKNNLNLLNTGLGSLADAKNGVWALNLTSNHSLTIEQARPLVTDITTKLLFMMYHNPKFAKYAKMTKSELTNEKMAFRLAFWDQNVNRPLYPYLAQIRLADGNIYYHYADPMTQALQEPIVQSIDSLVSDLE